MPPDQLKLAVAGIATLMACWDGGDAETSVDEAIEWALLDALQGAQVGVPYTFREQYAGRLVHDIRPAPGHECEESSRGRVPFRLHTDDAFLDATARPDRLALVGLRDLSNVPTTVVSIDYVLEQLDDDAIDILCQPSFLFRCPVSFAVGEGEVFTSSPRPVLHRSTDGTIHAALATCTRPAPGEHRAVRRSLDLLEAAVRRAPRIAVHLAPGEILVVSNSRCFHGRGGIQGSRWLKRVYLRDDLAVLDQIASTEDTGVYRAAAAFEHGERSHPAW